MKAESGKILIFGGTTEGRTVAERLLAEGLPCTVCVATQYGEEVLHPHPLMNVHTGRMDRVAMTQMMLEGNFSCVIDATHPHAQLVSQEIRAACEQTGLPYLRREKMRILKVLKALKALIEGLRMQEQRIKPVFMSRM